MMGKHGVTVLMAVTDSTTKHQLLQHKAITLTNLSQTFS